MTNGSSRSALQRHVALRLVRPLGVVILLVLPEQMPPVPFPSFRIQLMVSGL